MIAIVRIALSRPYTFVVMAILIAVRRAVVVPHADRHFPQYRHPRDRGRLELHRLAAGRHVGPHRLPSTNAR